MKLSRMLSVSLLPLLTLGLRAMADDGPPTVPATRAEMKQALEDSKRALPRLPLPPLTDEDRAKAKEPTDLAKGNFDLLNNTRMRKFYLPPELTTGGWIREPDANMTVPSPFQTQMFWIISRANNCTYCMGHQESKLASVGLSDDKIAALDGDWSEFTEAERAAFTFARKITYDPEKIHGDDLDAMRRSYTDTQILEILMACGTFNAMNRWTGALRIPQEEHRVYLGPTSEKYRDAVSKQAPLDPTAAKAAPMCARPAQRAALESRGEVEKALEACRARTPRLPLVDEAKAREIVAGEWSSDPLPQWVRLLATFRKAGPARIGMHLASETKGTLDPLIKAQIAWIAARNDRAWYALGHAQKRLRDLGQSDDAIFALDDVTNFASNPTQAAVHRLAKKLTVDPALVEDADIAALRARFTDKEVAEIVFQVTEAAYFDRLTEAAGLRLEK